MRGCLGDAFDYWMEMLFLLLFISRIAFREVAPNTGGGVGEVAATRSVVAGLIGLSWLSASAGLL